MWAKSSLGEDCTAPSSLVGDVNTANSSVSDGEGSAYAGFLTEAWSCNILHLMKHLCAYLTLSGASVFCWIILRKPEPQRFALQSCTFMILVTVRWQVETISFLLVFNDLLTYLISQSSK